MDHGEDSDHATATVPAAPPPGPRLHDAVEWALRAPSLHNSQPWRWRIGADGVALYADPLRRLPETDPDRRDLVISCGAALHHLQVALAAAGAAVRVDRFPDPEDEQLLATVRPVPGAADARAAALWPALGRRRTDRRRYATDPVPASTWTALGEAARERGATLVPVTGPARRAALDDVLARAADQQRRRPGYLAELMSWTHRLAGARDGIPATARPARPAPRGADPNRAFPQGRLAAAGAGAAAGDGAVLAVLCTPGDTGPDRLRAGEATSAVLLTAVAAGLATAPLSQALELPSTRSLLARDVLHVDSRPQLVVRLGFPVDDRELPRTPRRPLAAVLAR
ncbi:Acg family FMN-binding oxidoreductase [Pseudonocardia spirodelae]|uniref:NAD(P)H nitroreductase n=1 Tax=Pseudonocardia spirodelae TaxID=3133431 RepID=A0ABU8T2L3_9PSEU